MLKPLISFCGLFMKRIMVFRLFAFLIFLSKRSASEEISTEMQHAGFQSLALFV